MIALTFFANFTAAKDEKYFSKRGPFNSKHLPCLFRMQKSIDLKQKQRDEQVQKLKEKLEKVKDHDLWTTIVSIK